MSDQRQKKIDRHFPVYLDGRKCRILNYRIEGDKLTIITKIKNSNLHTGFGETSELIIEENGEKRRFLVTSLTVYYGVTIFYYSYRIIQEQTQDQEVLCTKSDKTKPPQKPF